MKTDSFTSHKSPRRYVLYSLASLVMALAIFAWQTLLPLYQQLNDLEYQYQQLLKAREIPEKQHVIPAKVSNIPTKALLSVVAGAANRSNVHIKSISYVKEDQVDSLNLIITDNLNAIRHFLQRLLTSRQVWLRDFGIRWVQDEIYTFKLNLRRATRIIRKTIPDLSTHTSFCGTNFLANMHRTEQDFSIEDLAMVGYVHFVANKPRALVRLPNLQVIEVKIGDRLGLQKAVIEKLEPRRLIAKHHQQTVILSMKN